MTSPPKTKSTESTESADAIATKEERDMMLAAIFRVIVPMIYVPDFPDPRAIGNATAAAMCIAAWQARGSITGAATITNTPPWDLYGQIRQALPDVYQELIEHEPLDDGLFPLIRVRWTGIEPEFLHEYVTWMTDHVAPRAHAENTKVVVLHDLGGLQGTPRDDLTATLALAQKLGNTTAVAALRGSVVLAPDQPDMMSLLDPIDTPTDARCQAGVIRFAAQPATAFDHAIQLLAATPADSPHTGLH